MEQKNKLGYHHGNLKNVLFETSVKLLKEEGPNTISLRKVAKVAGVTHTATYKHFKNKNDLLASIAIQGFNALEKQIVFIEKQFMNDPQQQLIEAGVAYVELAVKSPEITQLMFGEHINKELCDENYQNASNKTFDALLSIITNGVKENLYISHDPQALTLSLWSMIHGFAMLKAGKHLNSDIDSDQQIRILTRMLCKMLLNGIAK